MSVVGMNVRDAGKPMTEIASRIAAAKRSADAVLPTIGQPKAANSDDCATVCDPSLVKPLRQPKYTLDGMLAGMTEANRHEEIGRYVGQPQYRLLRAILDAAFNHAAVGKGKERHARNLPFDKQPMLETTRLVGPGFPLGQAIKKAGEAAGMIERGELDSAEAECLGAINYLAGAVAWVREQKAAAPTSVGAAA